MIIKTTIEGLSIGIESDRIWLYTNASTGTRNALNLSIYANNKGGLHGKAIRD